MRRFRFWLIGGGGLVLGFLAGRVDLNPSEEPLAAPLPTSRREPERTSSRGNSGSSSYADLERQFASLSGLRRSTAISGAVNRMDLKKVRQLLAEDAGARMNYYADFGEANLRRTLFQRWAELDAESLIAHGLTMKTAERGECLNYAFAAMAAQDYDAANARVQQLDADTRDSVQFAMLNSLATSDPAHAFQTALGSDNIRQRSFLPMVLSKWVASDPEGANAAFAALPPGKERQECLSVMAYSLAARDPVAALAWAEQLDNALEKSGAMGDILQNLAYTDPLQALSLLEKEPSLQSDRYGNGEISSIFQSLARLDFKRGMEEAMKLKDPAKRVKALAALASNGKQNHADELLALAATLPSAEAKALYLGDYWNSSQDPAATEAWLEKIPAGPLREQAKLRALNSLSYIDPEAAAKQLATLQPTMLRYDNFVAEIANNWSQQDPAKAMEWANGLTSFDQRKEALSQVYATLTNADPAASAARLAEIADPKMRSEITSSVMGRWAALDPNAALAWSNSLPAEDRSAALRQIAGSQINGNPTMARQVFDQMIRQLSPEEWNQSETRETAGRMASELAETDPQAAAKFAESLPVGTAQEEAYANVVGAWSRYAPSEAEAWLDQMPVGGIRDQAASTFVGTLANSDPAKAYQWAMSITDPALRRDAAAQSLRAWKANGQIEQARSVLAQPDGFSEQDLNELRKAIE